jgi:hypothetical protein
MRRILALVVMVLAASIGNAQATTITFEDLAIDDGAITGGDRTSGGFFFDSATDHTHIVQDASSWNTGNGTHFMLIDDVGGTHPPATDSVTFSPTLGGAFTLTSIDISEAHPNPFFSARQIEVTGNLFGGGTIFTTLALDNNLVNGVPGNYFQTFAFGAGWANLSSVKLNGVGALGGGNYYAIDNIVVGTAASVPEPGTLSLLALGSAYLIRRRRRNRR